MSSDTSLRPDSASAPANPAPARGSLPLPAGDAYRHSLQISGRDLKSMVLAGYAWLEQHKETVNALNVFPVPDGDTGTNMFLTMRAAWRRPWRRAR